MHNIDSSLRTKLVKFHISLTLFYRLLGIGLTYLLIPLTVNYLEIEQYGIWMTLLSIMSWVTFFDMGLGNGLRNKLAEALALNDVKLARIYISTSYAVISFISLIFFIILVLTAPLIPWEKVFNTTSISNSELLKVVFIVGFFFLLNFVLSISNQIFYASQKPSLPSLREVFSNLFLLFLLYLLIHFTSGSLIYLSICYCLSIVLSNLALTFYYFKKNNSLIPSIKYIELDKIKEITSLGIKFFIIQMAVLIIFTTDNLIITQVLGPDEVTPYNIVFRLFSIITMVHGIIITPLWSAFTDAYTKGDIDWIRNTINKLNLLMIPIIIIVILLIIFAKPIIKIWVGPQIKVSNLLVVLMGIYTVISVWNNIYAYFVNGIGKILPQLYSSIIAGVINIPLSIYFAKTLSMGTSGVILGTIVSLSLFAIVGPLQSYSIIKGGVRCIT